MDHVLGHDAYEREKKRAILVLLSNLKYWTLNPEESGPTINEIVDAHRACREDLRGPPELKVAYEETILNKRGSSIIWLATHGTVPLSELTRWDRVKNEIEMEDSDSEASDDSRNEVEND